MIDWKDIKPEDIKPVEKDETPVFKIVENDRPCYMRMKRPLGKEIREFVDPLRGKEGITTYEVNVIEVEDLADNKRKIMKVPRSFVSQLSRCHSIYLEEVKKNKLSLPISWWKKMWYKLIRKPIPQIPFEKIDFRVVRTGVGRGSRYNVEMLDYKRG